MALDLNNFARLRWNLPSVEAELYDLPYSMAIDMETDGKVDPETKLVYEFLSKLDADQRLVLNLYAKYIFRNAINEGRSRERYHEED